MKKYLSKIDYCVIGFIVVYMVLFATIPEARIWFQYANTSMGNVDSILFHTFFFVAFILLFLVFIIRSEPQLHKIFDKICSPQVVIPIGVLSMVGCILFDALKIPGLWWTWWTWGLQSGTVLLVYLFLKNKMSRFDAAMIGFAIAFLCIGLWEEPYQMGIYLVWYTKPLGMTQAMTDLWIEVVREVPLIVGSLLTLAYYAWIYKALFRVNKWVIILTALFIGGYYLWFATGFWQELLYNWNTKLFYEQPLNIPAKDLYRSTKVFLPLAVSMLFWYKEEIKLRKVKSERVSAHNSIFDD